MNPIKCFGTIESIGKNETHPVAKRGIKIASKGIAFIIIILIIFYIANVIYKIFLLNYLEERFKEYDTWNNYHIEIRSFEEGKLTDIREIWYKDNKYKIIIYNYYENQGKYTTKKWIDCNNNFIIIDREGENKKSTIKKEEIKQIYENGKLINSFFYWRNEIENRRENLILEMNWIAIKETKENTQLKTNEMMVDFEKGTIVPMIYMDTSKKSVNYVYYRIKLNGVNENDVNYKEDL